MRMHLSPLKQYKNAIILVILLIFASVNMESRILIIIFLIALFLLLRDQLWPVNIIGILQNNNLNNLANDPELYLYGHFSLDHIDNKRIVLATIQYVKVTRRFLT